MDQINEKELIEISGTVDAVIFRNEENGYTVLKMTDGSGMTQTVTGTMPFAAAGETILAEGEWNEHSEYGKQFKAEFVQTLAPDNIHSIYAYLASGTIKGIGPATASLIVNKFGEKSLSIMEEHPEKLAEISGISDRKARLISEAYNRQSGVRRLMEFICSFGVRPVLAMRLYRYYGDEALGVLQNNPYVLCSSHIGGAFAEADRLALEMGVDTTSENRIAAAVAFELQHNAGNGHCFIPQAKLAEITAGLIDVGSEEVEESIRGLAEEHRLVCEKLNNVDACYLPELYEAESHAAAVIAQMAREHCMETVDTDKLIGELEKEYGIHYAPLQRQTLESALDNRITVITGGPGTGKTTTVRAIAAMFDKMGLETLMAAPTGRAAKRMTEITGKNAVTVHRLLEAKFDDTGDKVIFQKHEREPLDCDAVILDESSMVDIILMDALLRALPPQARLVLVGDADQLPSVGPGTVFASIIRSGVVPTVCLKDIFRQKEGSCIVSNAHMINCGEHPDFSANKGDCFRMRRLDPASAVDTITELFARRLPDNMHIDREDIQVLSATRKGEMGTLALNKRLQAALNPPDKDKKEKPFGDVVFREGDRVMQIRNNYDLLWTDGKIVGTGVYNGDVGKITQISPEGETLTVCYDGRYATYGFDILSELEHAWALTVHKAQGSEYRAVILAMGKAAQMLMTRDVLYTAVSRAKDLLVLVGDDRLAGDMIDNNRKTKRYSFLKTRICRAAG